jgi:DNA invertase Pin-like site-specific DNA recombinase
MRIRRGNDPLVVQSRTLLSKEQISVIRNRRESGEKLFSIANDYGCSQTTIHKVTRDIIIAKNKRKFPEKPTLRFKLSKEQIAEARERRKNGEKLFSIAYDFNCCHTTIHKITKDLVEVKKRHNYILPDKDILLIRERRKKGEKLQTIARDFNCFITLIARTTSDIKFPKGRKKQAA